MKILKTIGVIIGVIIVIVIILGVIAPKNFDTKRSIVINAPPAVVYQNIGNLSLYEKWNPFRKFDSTQTTKIEGADGTVGAKFSWSGKKNGQGSMTIAKIDPNKSVDYDLVFVTPFGDMKSTSAMWEEPADGGQKVTWEFKGNVPFPINIMGLFHNMSTSMEPVFDEGLDTLKSICEAQAAAMPKYDVKETEWTGRNCVAIRKTVPFTDISSFFANNFGKIYKAITAAGDKPGIPLGVYFTWDTAARQTDLAAAIPYEGKKKPKGFDELDLPATKAYSVDYYGAYNKMMPAYNALDAKLKQIGQDKPALAIEEYLTDPMNEKDTMKWHTVIYYVLKSETAQK